MQKISKNKGITLVSLIVTMIILMILAGVVIATVTGNNGILSKSKLAKEKYQNSTNEENNTLSKYENEIDKATIDIASSREEINEIKYEGLTIKIGEDNQLKYYYQNKEILPIYWNGFEINGNSRDSITPWYETYNKGTIIKNDKDIIYSAYTTGGNYCVGGWTTKDLYNLGLYSKFHLLLKSSSVNTQMQYVSITGSLGYNYQANENRNLILTIDKFEESEGPKEFIGDISNVNGWYYMGIQSWNSSSNMDIIACWFDFK